MAGSKKTLIANYVLQMIGLALAILFGVYTALGYKLSKQSTQQAQIANQLALISFCVSDSSNNIVWADICATVAQTLDLTDIATTLALLPQTPDTLDSLNNGLLDKPGLTFFFIALGLGGPAFLVCTLVYYYGSRSIYEVDADFRGKDESSRIQ